MNWCMKKKVFRCDVYDEKGEKAAAIYTAGRSTKVITDKAIIWKIRRKTTEYWKITGSDCAYAAKIESDKESNMLFFPLKKYLTVEIDRDIYFIEHRVWMDAKIYCGRSKIASVRKNGLSDIVFTSHSEIKNTVAYLIAALIVLMQYEEQSVVNACFR